MMLHLKDSTGLPTGVEGMEEDCAPPPPRRELFKIWWGKGGGVLVKTWEEHWKAPKKWENI